MKIATFNTNSVRARLPILKDWISREQPGILALQEIKVQDKDFPVNDFDELGYYSIVRGQKAYNGVAILSRYSPENIRRNFYKNTDDQARFLSIDILPRTLEKPSDHTFLVAEFDLSI